MKKRILIKRDKNNAILFELQELNKNILESKPDNSDVVKLLEDLNNKIQSLEMKPEIRVESKEVKVEPKIEVKSPEVNVTFEERNIVNEIKSLKDKIFLDPNLKTNKLLSDLINKIDGIELKPIINVESKEVKVSPVFDPKIEVKPADVKIEKTDINTPIKWLYKALESVISDFFTKVIGFMGKVSEYIREPDRLIVSDKEITEFYGSKKVIYRIKKDGIKTEISRET